MRTATTMALLAALAAWATGCGQAATAFPANNPAKISGVPTDDGGESGTWQATSATGAPAARAGHTAVWSGDTMIIWGGEAVTGFMLAAGGRYTPSTDSWQDMTTTGAPEARWFHTALWTGTRMIVWGGTSNTSTLATGGIYDPVADAWSTSCPNLIAGNSAPAAREGHVAVWTGVTGDPLTQDRLIVWGGIDGNGDVLADGGVYDPAADSWSLFTGVTPPAERVYGTAVWMNPEMVVFGGADIDGNSIADGASYNPASGIWTALPSANQPAARAEHAAGYIGGRMVVWGGGATDDGGVATMNSGGVYDFAGWTATSTIGAPVARTWFTSSVTDSGFAVWGGFVGGLTASTMLGDGAIYNPGTDTWTAMASTGAPTAREHATAVWTGSEFIVWGGSDSSFQALNSGGRYTP